MPPQARQERRAYRGEAARAGWTHEADLLFDERTSAEELAERRARLRAVAEAESGSAGVEVFAPEPGNGVGDPVAVARSGDKGGDGKGSDDASLPDDGKGSDDKRHSA